MTEDTCKLVLLIRAPLPLHFFSFSTFWVLVGFGQVSKSGMVFFVQVLSQKFPQVDSYLPCEVK